MNIHRWTLTAAAVMMAACSSPPKPPTVDDSKKRPVNVAQALDLQVCRTELTATQIVLTETLTTQPKSQALATTPVPATPAAAVHVNADPTPNQIFVIRFPLGSADFDVPADERGRLLDQARMAKFILIRGRTDAAIDSMAETRLARRRAEAAYKYLVDQMRLPPEGIRLSWQGAGDPLLPNGQGVDKQANRRVEIELYRIKPNVEVLTVLRELRPLPSQTGMAGIL